MSDILETLGISANRPIPRRILDARLLTSPSGDVTGIEIDDRTLASIIQGLQLDIFKTASGLSRFTVSMGTTTEMGDAIGSGELYVDQDTETIYYDPPAKVNDSSPPAPAWVPIKVSSFDHGDLDGLGDDDHSQYLTEARHDALPSDNPHSVTPQQISAWEAVYSGVNEHALVDSVANNAVQNYRITLFGGDFNQAKIYMQELLISCRTNGSGSPSVRYTHIGPTTSLHAGVVVYWSSSASKYNIYIAQNTSAGFPAAKVIISKNDGTVEPITIGSFIAGTPVGTKVFDSTDHSTYPPTLLIDPAAKRITAIHTSTTTIPTTTEYPNNGDWGFHQNTLTGKAYLALNVGGTIKKVELT